MIAAIYSRKSKYSTAGDSIDNQIQLCKEYAQNQLKDKNITDFIIYEDEGFTGGNINRPEYKKMMLDAKNKKFDILICYRLDRVSRSVSDFSSTLDNLQKNDIDFVSIREQFDTSSPMGRAMIYIASVFAQLERETIAERVRDNMHELAKTGRWLGGTTPAGYKSKLIKFFDSNMNERSMYQLTEIPEELETIKHIYEKYIELGSLSKLETYALQHRLKTKRGANYGKANLRLILRNPVYVKSSKEVFNYLANELNITVCGEPDNIHGLLTYNKQKTIYNDEGKQVRVEKLSKEWIAAVSKHNGVIESEDWLKVQKLLKENKNRFVVSARTHHALLTGIIRCKKCGHSMTILHGRHSTKIDNKIDNRIYYYQCSMKRYSKASRCDSKNVRADYLDKIVIDTVKNMGLNKSSLLKGLENQQKKAAPKTTELNGIKKITNQIDTKKTQIDKLLNKLSLDEDLDTLILQKIKTLKEEIRLLDEDLINITQEVKKEDAYKINEFFIKTLLDKCSIIDSLSFDEQKFLVKNLFKEITWDSDTNTFDLVPIFYDNIDSLEEDKKK